MELSMFIIDNIHDLAQGEIINKFHELLGNKDHLDTIVNIINSEILDDNLNYKHLCAAYKFLLDTIHVSKFLDMFQHINDKDNFNTMLEIVIDNKIDFDIEKLEGLIEHIDEECLEKILNTGFRFTEEFALKFINDKKSLKLFIKYRDQATNPNWWVNVFNHLLSKWY